MGEPADPLLTRLQVEERLRISKNTLRRLIDRGELPVHKIAGQLRFIRADVDAYIASTRVPTRETS